MGSRQGQIRNIKKLWECGKGKLTEDEFKVLLLNTDIKERCAWHWAADWVKSEALEKACKQDKNKLKTEVL